MKEGHYDEKVKNITYNISLQEMIKRYSDFTKVFLPLSFYDQEEYLFDFEW